MTIRPLFIAYILSSSVHALAAQNQCPVTCPTTDRVLRTEFQTGMQSRKRCEIGTRLWQSRPGCSGL
jgi:hypothetical protein